MRHTVHWLPPHLLPPLTRPPPRPSHHTTALPRSSRFSCLHRIRDRLPALTASHLCPLLPPPVSSRHRPRLRLRPFHSYVSVRPGVLSPAIHLSVCFLLPPTVR